MPVNGDISSCSDASDISDDSPTSGNRPHCHGDICRDYLRNVCKRGSRCKYRHPSLEESKNLGRQVKYTFCHDFQNSGCHRPSCKFMHCTREEEEYYRQTGQLPVRLQQAAALGIGVLPNKLPLEKGLVPICKDHLKGECKRGPRCKFRHLSRNQYEQALRSSEITPEFAPVSANPSNINNVNPNAVVGLVSNNNNNSAAVVATNQYIQDLDLEYELASKRRRVEVVVSGAPYTSDFSTLLNSSPSFQATSGGGAPAQGTTLEEENMYLRRKVEMLKKQVSDLMATNEVLLDQNARYRVTKSNAVTTAPPIVTVSQVVTPTITPAPSMARPTVTPIAVGQQLTGGLSVLYEYENKTAEIIALSQQPPPPQVGTQQTLAAAVAQPPPATINPPPPTVAMAPQGNPNVIVPVTLMEASIPHPNNVTTVSMGSGGLTSAPPPPITVSLAQTSIPAAPPPQTPQILGSAHSTALVSYPLISHAQLPISHTNQIPSSSMG